jgi:BirA family transcriptional regulator, biotin operon repressor / biotin---[acetyl-CoA-carboxylase] ligase
MTGTVHDAAQAPPPDIDAARLRERLHTRCFGRSMHVCAETGSTMDDAREVAATAPDGHVILADRQRAGRGAHGRGWESPGGTDLYLSIVVRRSMPDDRRPLLTLAAGLGVAEAVEQLAESPALVKWPNDVWLQRRKCAGILVESRTEGAAVPVAVVGIGVNVNRRMWPSELEGQATSIALCRRDHQAVDRADAFAQVLTQVEAWVDRLCDVGERAVVDALDRRLALRGEAVTVDGTAGVLVGIAPNGAALLQTPAGVREIIAGRLTPATT